MNSCSAAWAEIRRAKSTKKKEIFGEKLRQWREETVKAIREWLPKFASLAEAYPEAVDGDLLRWVRDQVWERVELQCDIRRPIEGVVHKVDHTSRSMVFWFAAASEGDSEVNLPPQRPFTAPGGLARNRKETQALLRDHTRHFWRLRSHISNAAV